MERRQFLRAAAASGCYFSLSGQHQLVRAQSPVSVASEQRSSFALDGHRIRFTHPGIREPWNMIMLADTHLFRHDDRDAEFRQFSARMARAYNQTEHFQTKAPTHPEECLQQTLALAQDSPARLIALVGDIVSFPSQAAVDWLGDQLRATGLPYLYVAGNHDWHYEGMTGSLAQLRDTWIRQRLQPLYDQSAQAGTDSPLAMSVTIGGVTIVALDNSNYEITADQLAYFQRQVATGCPLLLLLHIPLYAPGRPVGFGCGHPKWNAASDQNYELERREQWPAGGHSPVTFEFHRTVFNTTHLLGVLAGHIHQPSLDIVQGIPQAVTGHNATGAHLAVEFWPAS